MQQNAIAPERPGHRDVARGMIPGGITLSPGGRKRGVAVFITASLVWASLMLFINAIQPYQLSEMLGVPMARQGAVTGQLVLIQNLCVILFAGLFGHLSDRYGRSPMIVGALVTLALASFLMPLAISLAFLFGFRFLFGAGAAAMAASAAPLAQDYPANASRGRFLALLMVTQGLAVMLLVNVVAARLPAFLGTLDVAPALAGRYVYWAMAALGLGGALIALLGLARDPIAARRHRDPAGPSPSLAGSLREMIALARRNPRFEMVMLLAFVFRSEDAMIYSFLPLWVTHSGNALGHAATRSLADVGSILLVVSGTTIVASIGIGAVIDRFDRTKTLLAALLTTALAYLLTLTLLGGFGVGSYLVFALLAAAETSVVMSAQALFGQEIPASSRGAFIGIIATTGTAAMLLLSLAGGYLFDAIAPAAPFAMMGIVNLAVALRVAVLLRRCRSTPG